MIKIRCTIDYPFEEKKIIKGVERTRQSVKTNDYECKINARTLDEAVARVTEFHKIVEGLQKRS